MSIRWKYEKVEGKREARLVIAGIPESIFIHIMANARFRKYRHPQEDEEESRLYEHQCRQCVRRLRLAIAHVEQVKRGRWHRYLGSKTVAFAALSKCPWKQMSFRWDGMTIYYSNGTYTVVEETTDGYRPTFEDIITRASLEANSLAQALTKPYPHLFYGDYFPKYHRWLSDLRTKAIDKYNNEYFGRKEKVPTVADRWRVVREEKKERLLIDSILQQALEEVSK